MREGKIQYHWDFGDGLSTVSEEPLIEHAYDLSGEYVAVLTAVQSIDQDELQLGFQELVSTSPSPLGYFPVIHAMDPPWIK